MRGCRIDKSDEFDESFVFQADLDPSKTMINVVFVDGIMFQAVLTGCRIDKSAEFYESFAFQADFDPSATMKNVVFVDGIVFLACFAQNARNPGKMCAAAS